MSVSAAFREALSDGDASRVMNLWRTVYPGLPQLRNLKEARGCMHRARTEAESIRLEKRLYSHAWLAERGLPSGLPDELRPPAEQIRPRVVYAVGVSVNSRHKGGADLASAVEAAMGQAAGEMIDAGIIDSKRVSAHMWAARDRVLKGR